MTTPLSPDAEYTLIAMGKAVNDLSQRALRFARIIDRLEPGTYTLTIEKDIDGRGMRVRVARIDVTQNQEWKVEKLLQL